MTHTLHREGDLNNLSNDYVVFSMSAKKINSAGSAEKLQKFYKIVEKFEHVSLGDMQTGNIFNQDRKVIFDNIQDTSVVHFVCVDKKVVSQIVAELKAAALGPSVIISGLVDDVREICASAGIHMHTVEFSGGIHGQRELLADSQQREITTMCGHGMVAANLVEDMLNKIKKGKKSIEDAAIELSKPCQCGIFNPKRTEDLIKNLLEN